MVAEFAKFSTVAPLLRLGSRGALPMTTLLSKINQWWTRHHGTAHRSPPNLWSATLLLPLALRASAGELNLIPWPESVEVLPGQFALDAQTSVVADAPLATAGEQLRTLLKLNSPSVNAPRRVLLTTNGAANLGAEAYQLEVNSQGVILRAQTAAGAFYGSQTLRQLLNVDTRTLPAVKITDAPRYVWRGLMLDVSRHFFDQATIFRLLDWMAEYKLNRFHIHLADDQGWRIAINQYPELTKLGATGNFTDTNAAPRFFTQPELKEIVAYAACRYIVVVPEIDMPGHAGAATRAYPEIDGGVHTYHPAREATYDFLQNMLREVATIFPSPWIHFGGDEVNSSGWKNDPQITEKLKAEGLQQPQQLEGYFVRRMAKFISQQGRVPMGWDEITAANPATNTVIFWWRQNKPEVLAQALAAGYPVVLTPRSPCYFDYPQDKSYQNFSWKLFNTPEAVYDGPKIPAPVTALQQKNILGVEGCVWTERIATVPYLEFMLLPRLTALAEMAWTADSQRDYGKFSARLQPRLEQFHQQGIHPYNPAEPAESLREATATKKNQPTASR